MSLFRSDNDAGGDAMLIGCTMDLLPMPPPVPFRSLLSKWMRAQFAPAACRRITEQAIGRDPHLADFLDPAAIDRGEMVATHRLLYGWCEESDRPWLWVLDKQIIELAASDVYAVARIIRAAARCEDQTALRVQLTDYVQDADSIENLLALIMRPAQHAGRWPAVDGPGIYRREHASVIIRSRTTTILTDPKGLARDWTTNQGRYPSDDGVGPISGIAITHGHSDHWHLPSILRYSPTASTKVIVPPVPRVSLLSDIDLVETLTDVDVDARAPSWNSTVTIGDIEIDVMAFYGEQPTRDRSVLPVDVRNWGCCYRFNTPDFSALLLVDSGIDPEGSMLDVIGRSVERRGPVDVLLSQLSEFPEAANIGLPHYAFVIPFDYLADAWQRTPRASITLGAVGVAKACRIAQARFFLPYAHGFRGIGQQPRCPEAGKGESSMLSTLDVSSTTCLPWLPGDVATWSEGRLRHMSTSSAAGD